MPWTSSEAWSAQYRSPGWGTTIAQMPRQGWLAKVWRNGCGFYSSRPWDSPPVPGGWRENPLPADFSVDASVRIEADDRAGLERLLRYCARPPFALERLEAIDAQRLIYRLSKPQLVAFTRISRTSANRIYVKL